MIHIICSTDHNYVMPTGVMMKSVSINNSCADITFHVVIDESVTNTDKKNLESVVGG